jgi:hypothetical protein
VFENRVLRRIFGPKRDEVTEEWRRLHKKELYAVYSLPYHSGDQVKKTQMGRACGMGGANRALAGKPEGMRPLERPRRRWKGNIKMDL